MLASVQSMGLSGIEGYKVTVEAFCTDGMPMYELVGLPDAAVKESRERVLRHRAQREGLGFETVERRTDLAGAELPAEASVLLEDLSNLLANEMFMPAGGDIRSVREGLSHLEAVSRHLTVVSNELFSDGRRYEGDTLRYMEQLAELNRELARRADLVVEVVCGLPNVLKGSLP